MFEPMQTYFCLQDLFGTCPGCVDSSEEFCYHLKQSAADFFANFITNFMTILCQIWLHLLRDRQVLISY